MLGFKKLTYSQLLETANNLWGLFCIVAVIAMAGILGYWVGQPQFIYAVTQSTPMIVDISEKGGSYYPNVIISGVGKAEYTQWIESMSGEVVHKYKAIELSNKRSDVRHEQVFIPSLPPGMYYVKAKMINQPNPVKTTQLEIVLGIINVVSEN